MAGTHAGATVEARPDAVIESDWLTSLAPVRQLLSEGLDLSRATVLVGENGTGKSTLVEAIAMAFGMNGEGGSTGAIHTTWTSESPLHDWLQLVRGAGASRWGYFVRAETMHGLFTFLDGTRRESHTLIQNFIGSVTERRSAPFSRPVGSVETASMCSTSPRQACHSLHSCAWSASL